MAADTYNTVIDQGADWYLSVVYEAPNGTPINITGFTAALQLRTSPLARTAALTLTTQNGGISITGATGTVSIHATAAQTMALVPQRYSYDLELYNGSIVTRLIQGTIQVSAETTR
jgi:hypothetical protein